MTVISRPINLDLRTIRFGVTAIVSILHRITGVALFFTLPLLLWLLQHSLASQASFADVERWLQAGLWRWVIWAFLVCLFYHLCAGIRHLLMDCHCGETLKAARMSAYLVFSVTILLSIGAGCYLW